MDQEVATKLYAEGDRSEWVMGALAQKALSDALEAKQQAEWQAKLQAMQAGWRQQQQLDAAMLVASSGGGLRPDQD